MDESKQQHTYIIVDPNRPEQTVNLLQRILLEKLLVLPMDEYKAGEGTTDE